MDQPGQAELLRQFQNQLAGMTASDVQEVFHHLTGPGGALAGAPRCGTTSPSGCT